MRGHTLLCGLLGLATAACGAGWRRPAQLTPGPWPERQQVQVWTNGRAVRWHGVVIRGDSISGVAFLRPLDCDSCRRAIALTAVDSVRVGHPVAGFWKTLGLVIGIPVLVVIAVCGSDGSACFPET